MAQQRFSVACAIPARCAGASSRWRASTGRGKTTIAHRVESELRKKGHRVVLTTEPTRTWRGDAVKKSYDDDVGPLAETFLFLAARAPHTVQIQEWLPQGAAAGSGRDPA